MDRLGAQIADVGNGCSFQGKSVEGGQGGHGKCRNLGLEFAAVALAHHGKVAFHLPDWTLEVTATDVFMAFPWRKYGLQTHHTIAFDLAFAAISIGNEPYAAQQLHRFCRLICDANAVCKGEVILGWVGLRWQKCGLHTHQHILGTTYNDL